VLAGGAHSRREALSEASPAAPSGAYGRSKRAAERVLASHRDFSWIALRLPLVHGPGARANFARLMRLAQSQLPAPFAAITARRSLIGVDSAVRALIAARRADGASGAFYVADRPALTVGAMIAALRAGLGHPPGLVAAPGLGLALSASPLSALATPLEADDTAFRAAFPEFRPAHEDSFAALADTARRWDERA
jgi:UDP-glucose 4-epimerase